MGCWRRRSGARQETGDRDRRTQKSQRAGARGSRGTGRGGCGRGRGGAEMREERAR
ncbi:hypothetical protein CC85DRAFT_137345 [Cutaneotrichosporon oleaginosum]|uniref:Uncharacterized protein n=1 Tax=Cutaneotrichosporon oleaginosum TaxID=879819 RepID=A0A0J0XWV8_9TREE|nr:uncharacterized protein CC85DRAFT_137345 [Cutaneotrichosporon oleaginosum]KLT45550.1 hypothetical protein CC85DRAFT_137345 [Cutaneotrichosporon oleaginosum]TXT14496.1 hypothetical protein COLE_00689 [Cutaneotrichosporon oleaginosum]